MLELKPFAYKSFIHDLKVVAIKTQGFSHLARLTEHLIINNSGFNKSFVIAIEIFVKVESEKLM